MRTGVHRYQLAAHSAATQNMLSSIDLFRHNDLSSPESASNVPLSLRYLARDIVGEGFLFLLDISFAFFTHVGCAIYAVPRQPQCQEEGASVKSLQVHGSLPLQ